MAWRPDNFDFEIPAWVKSVAGLMRDVMDFCYPGICPVCRDVCTPGRELCDSCTVEIEKLAGTPSCFFCGLTLAYFNAPCPNCGGKGVSHYERVIRLGKFDLPIRPLIHHLKFHRAWSIGEFLAERMLAQDHVESLLQEADCLMPVPLHGVRQFARGFNQADVIARRISRTTGLPVIHPVSRVRDTVAQYRLRSRAQRMRNLKNAFQLRDHAQVEGKRVVVIDDVMTTGATLQTLARTLRAGKPKSLSALVVAVAENKGGRVK